MTKRILEGIVVSDKNNKFKNGDKVTIIECRPYSKNKKFKVMEL